MSGSRVTGAVCGSALVLALCPGAAHAGTFTAACSGTTGDTASLVAAINQANAAAGADAVQLGQGCLYTLTAVDNNSYGPNGLPEIKSDVTVEGNGATIARSSSAPKLRLFFVGADPASPTTDNYVTPGAGRLTLRELTLDNGLAKGGDSFGGGGGAGMGGAIFSQGTVVIERSTLTRNTAQGGSAVNGSSGAGGGGIGADSGVFGGGGFDPGSSTSSGGGGTGGGGGGAGFRTGEAGSSGTASTAGAGGGPQTGLGNTGGFGAVGGDGSGGGGDGSGGGVNNGFGGAFGSGGFDNLGVGGGGGGGGVGGGGGAGTAGGGGGGFGGGGGRGGTDPGNGGGGGGFGGGGGGGRAGAGGGFGGGTAPDGTGGDGGGGAGLGGAIFNMQGELTISNSTLAGNTALAGAANGTGGGNGIGGAVFNLSGSFTAVGSTFAANAAAFDGASIYNLLYDSATARTAQTTLRDTIVSSGTLGLVDLASDKPAATGGGSNLGSAGADVGQFDLVRTMAARNGGTISGSPLTADPQLGPLQPNGGPTQTMAPASGSPVIDAGSAFGLTIDQRGLPRPSDVLAGANAGDGSDIGAFELQASPTIDADGDGSPVGVDCNDADAAIHPGAPEVPGNAIDENCDGVVAPFPKIASTVSAAFAVTGGATKVKKLRASKIPAGAQVILSCKLAKKKRKTHACAFRRKKRSYTKETGRDRYEKLFHKRKLPVGTVIEIRITAPGSIGTVVRFKTRRGKRPSRRLLCLPPGVKAPAQC